MSKAHDKALKLWAQRRESIIRNAQSLSMGEVGRMFGISRQRVRQIVNGKLKASK